MMTRSSNGAKLLPESSRLRVTMGQLGPLSTAQFGWVKSSLFAACALIGLCFLLLS